MARLRAGALFLPLLFLLSCGRENDPESRPQAVFEIRAPEGTPFEVVEIRAGDAVHRPCLDGRPEFPAPYRFVLERARLEIQGIFRPVDPSRPLSDAQLRIGGESVPRRVDLPDETKPLHTGPQPRPPDDSVPVCGFRGSGREVRFDVSGTPGTRFDATIGDFDGTHLVGPGPVPATFFLEESSEGAFGVFRKLDREGQMEVRLLVDGRERDRDFSAAGRDEDLVVEFDF
ncbi:MAG: hypothetical protein KatS3mg076_0274 [Candidatus Binatia bacterium]|nr:MAG: hypothetical protein KatS3mg076_0274 [Candidatus Binatia bacterium]